MTMKVILTTLAIANLILFARPYATNTTTRHTLALALTWVAAE